MRCLRFIQNALKTKAIRLKYTQALENSQKNSKINDLILLCCNAEHILFLRQQLMLLVSALWRFLPKLGLRAFVAQSFLFLGQSISTRFCACHSLFR